MNKEQVVQDFIQERLDQSSMQYKYYRNQKYYVGEIDFRADYKNYSLIFEIKCGKDRQVKATSQLERAAMKCPSLQGRRVFGFYVHNCKDKTTIERVV